MYKELLVKICYCACKFECLSDTKFVLAKIKRRYKRSYLSSLLKQHKVQTYKLTNTADSGSLSKKQIQVSRKLTQKFTMPRATLGCQFRGGLPEDGWNVCEFVAVRRMKFT